MTKRKKSQRQRQNPQVPLRAFAEWPLAQVEQVARMLYSLAPFKGDLWQDEFRWKALARQAFDLLDNLHWACEEVAKGRSVRHDAHARANALLTQADNLPDIVPFDKAVRHITGEKRTHRALSKFGKILQYNARREPVSVRPHSSKKAGLLPKLPAKKKKQIKARLEMWRKNGIPRHKVMELQSLFKYEWPLVLTEENRAKRVKSRGAKLPDDRQTIEVVRQIVQESDLT